MYNVYGFQDTILMTFKYLYNSINVIKNILIFHFIMRIIKWN